MLVSKKRYDKLQSECDSYRATVEAREREVHYWEDGYYKLAKRLIATENALKDVERVRDVYKRDVDELGASLETLEGSVAETTGRANQLAQENEGLIAEGAKLADELAELRKAPEIKGVRVSIGEDPSFFIEGATEVRVIESGPREMLIGVGEKRGGKVFETAQYARVTGWVLVPAEPVGKSAEKKPVATKKTGRK